MKPKLALAALLSLGLGSIAVLLNLEAATVSGVPTWGRLLVPLVTLGLAPLPGVVLVGRWTLRDALLVAAALQLLVTIGAAAAASKITGPSFGNSLAYMAFYAFCELLIITTPCVIILSRVFRNQ